MVKAAFEYSLCMCYINIPYLNVFLFPDWLLQKKTVHMVDFVVVEMYFSLF